MTAGNVTSYNAFRQAQAAKARRSMPAPLGYGPGSPSRFSSDEHAAIQRAAHLAGLAGTIVDFSQDRDLWSDRYKFDLPGDEYRAAEIRKTSGAPVSSYSFWLYGPGTYRCVAKGDALQVAMDAFHGTIAGQAVRPVISMPRPT